MVGLLSAAVTLGSGCGGGGGATDAGVKPEVQCDGGEADVSFATVYSDLISPTCLGGCHVPGGSNGPVNLTSADAGYEGSVGKNSITYGSSLKIVQPNQPESSTLYLKVLGGTPGGYRGPTGQSVGERMPPLSAGNGATAQQKELVRRWICTGAAP
jgi:hypothetical protein